jgi:hypothetical protein
VGIGETSEAGIGTIACVGVGVEGIGWTVEQRFADVVGGNGDARFEIGDGSRDLEKSVVRAGGESEASAGVVQDLLRLGCGSAVAVDGFGIQVGVGGLLAMLLDFACG